MKCYSNSYWLIMFLMFINPATAQSTYVYFKTRHYIEHYDVCKLAAPAML